MCPGDTGDVYLVTERAPHTSSSPGTCAAMTDDTHRVLSSSTEYRVLKTTNKAIFIDPFKSPKLAGITTFCNRQRLSWAGSWEVKLSFACLVKCLFSINLKYSLTLLLLDMMRLAAVAAAFWLSGSKSSINFGICLKYMEIVSLMTTKMVNLYSIKVPVSAMDLSVSADKWVF